MNHRFRAARRPETIVTFNDDGSVDLYFGPEALAGKESNWVQTMPNKAWFPYFRLYSPTQPFLDQTWVLPDFQKAD